MHALKTPLGWGFYRSLKAIAQTSTLTASASGKLNAVCWKLQHHVSARREFRLAGMALPWPRPKSVRAACVRPAAFAPYASTSPRRPNRSVSSEGRPSVCSRSKWATAVRGHRCGPSPVPARTTAGRSVPSCLGRERAKQSFIWQRSLKKGQSTRVPFELALKLALDLTFALVQLPLAIPELVTDAVVFVAAFAAVPEAFPVPLAVPFAIVQIPVMVALPRLAEKLARLGQRMHAVRCVVRGMASLKSWNVRLASGRALPWPKPRLTWVGLAFSLGKLMFVCFSCSVDGLHGVGGNRRPWPWRRVTNTG